MVANSSPVPSKMRILALWIYRDEIPRATNEQVWSAHTSQPIGEPLHNHKGFIEVTPTSVVFEEISPTLAVFDEKEDRKEISKSEIKDLQVSYDDNFRQWRDSRGADPPMHFSFGSDEVYIFTLGEHWGYWQGKNTALAQALGPVPSSAPASSAGGAQSEPQT